MSTGRGRRREWIIVGVIAAALAAGGILRARWVPGGSGGRQRFEKVSLKVAPEMAPVSLGQFHDGFASVIDPVLPAVVNISSTKVVKRPNVPDLFNDPFFRQFFGNQAPRERTEREYSLGSGVIVNSDGYILTNNHVVQGASDVEVVTPANTKYKANIVGTDPRTDVAVLKVDATGLPTITIGDSSKIKVGDLVFAIGDPFGIGETATGGIVSATGRGLGGAIERYEDFIQTDAAINPGNSGGALIDIRGFLIGINTAILSGGGGNEGVGFAIPVNLARHVMEQIIDHGKVIRGYLGVTIQAVSPDMAKAFGLSRGGGALVGDVATNGPAAKAGIQRGDIITEFNGQQVNGPDDLSVRTSELAPGTAVHLKVFRDGQSRDIQATLGEYPETAASTGASSRGQATALRGLRVEPLTRQILDELGLPNTTKGVVVSSVDPNSAAAQAGIQEGDIIQEVNRKPVQNMEEYDRAIANAGNNTVLLLINRKGTTLFTVLEPHP
jgi:serine protease Do